MIARRLAVALALAVLVGCEADDGDGDPDEGADSGEARDGRAEGSPRDGSAEGGGEVGEADAGPSAGPLTQLIRRLELTHERLCDLDGDGLEDNAFADLGEAQGQLATVALNSIISSAADRSGNRSGIHLPWVDDLRRPSDEEVVVLCFHGLDLDSPIDPSDDYSGEEPFYASAQSLDGCGEPAHFFPSARIADGELSATSGSFPVPLSMSELLVRQAELSGRIEPGGATAELLLCAAAHARDLGEAQGMEEAGGLNALEMLLAGGAPYGIPSFVGLSPNLDLDGDGIERFEVDEDGRVVGCVDGDMTPISGADCWRDERIADGFALSVRLEMIRARFEGRQPSWEAADLGECPDGPPEESLFDPR